MGLCIVLLFYKILSFLNFSGQMLVYHCFTGILKWFSKLCSDEGPVKIMIYIFCVTLIECMVQHLKFFYFLSTLWLQNLWYHCVYVYYHIWPYTFTVMTQNILFLLWRLFWLYVDIFQKESIDYHLKLLSAIFYQICIFHRMVALQKLWKMFFISSKNALFVLEIFKFLYFCLPLFFSLSAIALEVVRR